MIFRILQDYYEARLFFEQFSLISSDHDTYARRLVKDMIAPSLDSADLKAHNKENGCIL